MSTTSLYIKEKKIHFLARYGKLLKTVQGLWTTDSVCSDDNGAFIGDVAVGLGHITSIGGIEMAPTIQYREISNMIERAAMNDIIVEIYPTNFCQDCQCPLSNETPEMELNYTMCTNYSICTFCGLTQFTRTAMLAKLENTALQNTTKKKSYRNRNLERIYGKIQEIGSKFPYQFLGLRAIISSARFKLIAFSNSVPKLPHGGDAFAGACFFAAACEFRNSRFGRGQIPVTLEIIALFSSDCENSTKQFGTKINTTSDRILTLVKKLITRGLCTDNIPELKRMELFHNRIQKKIMLNCASKPLLRFKMVQECAIAISDVQYEQGNRSVGTVEGTGILVGDLVESCNGIRIAITSNVNDLIETIRKYEENNKMVILTIQRESTRRKSTKKRKR
jgi:hypothetical protein